MKKTVIIEILLVCVLAILLSCAIISLRDIPSMNDYIEYFTNLDPKDGNYEIAYIIASNTEYYVNTFLSIGIPTLIAAVADLAAIIIIAIKDFPIIKRWVDNFKTKCATKKQIRNTIAKQKRIKQLQSELDELKKDA